MVKERNWAEIRNNHFDEEDKFWYIDAWKTDDEEVEEEGKVIAMVDDLTGRVIYLDPVARFDEYAQEAIHEVLERIEPPRVIAIDFNLIIESHSSNENFVYYNIFTNEDDKAIQSMVEEAMEAFENADNGLMTEIIDDERDKKGYISPDIIPEYIYREHNIRYERIIPVAETPRY